MIRLNEVTLCPGGEPIVEDVNWHIHPKEHVGLVGRNGTGKTTILRAIAGELTPDRGKVILREGASLGYLPQQAVAETSRSVWDEARSGMVRLNRLNMNLEIAQLAVAQGRPGAIERHAEAMEVFRVAGGFSQEETIGSVLYGLGFAKADWQRPCSTFSGGWQMRIALARLLLAQPDIALLDEPTNHLDLAARTWLAHFLDRAPFTVVLVAHDRHLLDRVATRVAEVHMNEVHHYTGNFTAFLRQRRERREQQLALYKRQQKEIVRQQRFVDRFKATSTKSSQARSVQKRLDKLEVLKAPETVRLPRFSLPPAPIGAYESIILRQASMGWPNGPAILEDVSLLIQRGMRVAILGPNGCGKSTLLQTLARNLPLFDGEYELGDRSRIGVFTQDLAAALPANEQALSYLCDAAPTVLPEQIRAILGALGVSGEMSLRLIDELSGGEKARVALTALACQPHNILLLDEPTNHLDLETIEVLVRTLSDFDGTMVFVTHDRYVIEQVATHTLRISGTSVDFREGVFLQELEQPDEEVARGSNGAQTYEERKRAHREKERAKRRISEIEAEIERLEGQLNDIDQALFDVGADFERANALAMERRELESTLNVHYDEWESLEMIPLDEP